MSTLANIADAWGSAERAGVTPCRVCGYFVSHQHHILPKKYGGGDEKDNLIALCPNHHAAIHVLLSDFIWQYRAIGTRQLSGKSTRPRSDRHCILLAAVSRDTVLMTLFKAEFLPRWEAAAFPLSVPYRRRAERMVERMGVA